MDGWPNKLSGVLPDQKTDWLQEHTHLSHSASAATSPRSSGILISACDEFVSFDDGASL